MLEKIFSCLKKDYLIQKWPNIIIHFFLSPRLSLTPDANGTRGIQTGLKLKWFISNKGKVNVYRFQCFWKQSHFRST